MTSSGRSFARAASKNGYAGGGAIIFVAFVSASTTDELVSINEISPRTAHPPIATGPAWSGPGGYEQSLRCVRCADCLREYAHDKSG